MARGLRSGGADIYSTATFLNRARILRVQRWVAQARCAFGSASQRKEEDVMLSRRGFVVAAAGAVAAVPVLNACQETFSSAPAAKPAASLGGNAQEIAARRGLSADDISAALMTYTPSGKLDEYVMFSSGGHSGQVLVIGLPSMRILKVIAVFTPES